MDKFHQAIEVASKMRPSLRFEAFRWQVQGPCQSGLLQLSACCRPANKGPLDHVTSEFVEVPAIVSIGIFPQGLHIAVFRGPLLGKGRQDAKRGLECVQARLHTGSIVR